MTGSPEVPSEDFCMKRLLSTASITCSRSFTLNAGPAIATGARFTWRTITCTVSGAEATVPSLTIN